MSVLIIGANGSMGKRYQAILKHLGKRFVCIDKDDEFPNIIYDGYIVASPTPTHAGYLYRLSKLKKPVLCEKPISTNIQEVEDILHTFEDSGTPLKMMTQYDAYPDKGGNGLSYYNYFRHGADGLVWDCMQIIGLARGEISLHEDSPVWVCQVNGQKLNINVMDTAYVYFVERWFHEPKSSLQRIRDIHIKTDTIAKQYAKGGYDRNTGKINQQAIPWQGS